jgi:riboflavin biosynthesis pyrimidine reductase
VNLTRVHPGPPETLDMDAAATRDRLLELYAPPRQTWLRLNLVLSAGGSAAGSDGTSETLTSVADRRILGVIRELAELVLVGAQSVRAEGYQVPRRTPLAVVTSSGDLSGHRIGGDGLDRMVVVGPASARDAAQRTLGDTAFVTVPDTNGRLAAADIIGAVRDAGYGSIVCEGGPGLARQLVTAGLVDEVCLTTSPRLTAATLPLLGTEPFPEVQLELAQLILDDESSLFARWLTPGGRASS